MYVCDGTKARWRSSRATAFATVWTSPAGPPVYRRNTGAENQRLETSLRSTTRYCMEDYQTLSMYALSPCTMAKLASAEAFVDNAVEIEGRVMQLYTAHSCAVKQSFCRQPSVRPPSMRARLRHRHKGHMRFLVRLCSACHRRLLLFHQIAEWVLWMSEPVRTAAHFYLNLATAIILAMLPIQAREVL